MTTSFERGLRFILSKQGADGLWHDFLTPAGEASEWPSGFIAATLVGMGVEAGQLRPCVDALVAHQNEDGGWGYHEDVPTDADSTACVLLFLARIGGHEDVCRRAVSCLAAHRRPAGGLATYRESGPIRAFMHVPRWMRFRGWCSPHIEVTATAGRALAACGAHDPAAAAWGYVRPLQRPDGAWSSYWWTSPHYATQQAVELALLMGDRDAAGRAAAWARTAGAEGAFEAALSLSILAAAGAAPGELDPAAADLRGLQDEDGGWPSRPIMRIPYPGDADPDRRRRFRGIVVADQHRTFTSAVCVAALAAAGSY